jgi:transcriptional regulator with XRE-family HTH domain
MADQARGIAFPLYQRVATERAQQGWTWTRLTAQAGVARSTINSWAHIQAPPQPEKVNAVADLLGIPRMEALRLAGVLDGTSDEARCEFEARILASGVIDGRQMRLIIEGHRQDEPEHRWCRFRGERREFLDEERKQA